ncbi:MAG TPA: glycosyltransferase family 2 protein [Thermoanaerobaculia bacterium]|nr:glycosyltransferase family 2 protein [Thermoanaerobaculia bacterium]
MTALAGAAAAAALISLLLLGVNVLVFRPLGEAAPPLEWPSVSVVIPARDEERDLARTLEAHAESSYPRLEVIVVDDRSTDRTGEIARRFAERDARFRVVTGVEPPPGWLGKPHALHEGAGAASGEWLLFADADVVYGRDAIRRAVAAALRRSLALLCLLPRLETRGFWEGVVMPNIYALLYLGPGFVTQIDRVKAFAGGSGSGNLVERRGYEASGGHAAIRDAVIDDLGLAISMKRAGKRTRAFPAYDDVRVRMYRGFREAFDGFSKNVAYLGPPVPALILPLAMFVLAAAPWLVLALPASSLAKAFAAAAIAATLLGRVAVARVTRTPVWSALFHPLMIGVWTGIAMRSWYRRVVRRQVIWRGRTLAAPNEKREDSRGMP